MQRYIFTVTISGFGNNPTEAWCDAIDQFAIDPGPPIEEGMIIEREDEI